MPVNSQMHTWPAIRRAPLRGSPPPPAPHRLCLGPHSSAGASRTTVFIIPASQVQTCRLGEGRRLIVTSASRRPLKPTNWNPRPRDSEAQANHRLCPPTAVQHQPGSHSSSRAPSHLSVCAPGGPVPTPSTQLSPVSARPAEPMSPGGQPGPQLPLHIAALNKMLGAGLAGDSTAQNSGCKYESGLLEGKGRKGREGEGRGGEGTHPAVLTCLCLIHSCFCVTTAELSGCDAVLLTSDRV